MLESNSSKNCRKCHHREHKRSCPEPVKIPEEGTGYWQCRCTKRG